MNFYHYRHRFTHLRVARSRQHGEAPYKPALLLAVLEGIDDGSILDNRIYITPELLASFRSLCRALSTSELFRANDFSLPFYHLSGDGFWHLHTLPGLEVLLTASRSVKSFRNLRDTADYATLDAELWALLQHPTSARCCVRHCYCATFRKRASVTNQRPAPRPLDNRCCRSLLLYSSAKLLLPVAHLLTGAECREGHVAGFPCARHNR